MSDRLSEARVDETLAEVFNSPPFSGDAVDTEGAWLAVVRSLYRWYENFAGDLYLDRPVLFWTLFIGLSILAAFLIWHLSVSMRHVVRAMRREGPVDEDGAASGQVFDLSEARQALAGGQPRLAVELAWGVAVAASRPAGKSLAHAITPRQQARALSEDLGAEAAAQLQRLLRAHEEACYAGRAPTLELATEALAAATILVEG